MSVHGLQLGPTREAGPGPGLWPLITGCGTALGGLLLLTIRRNAPRRPSPGPLYPRREKDIVRSLAGFVLACALWLALLPSLGWIPATAVATGTACFTAGSSLRQSLWTIALLVSGLYLGIEVLLRNPLPGGAFARLVEYVCEYIRQVLFGWILPAPAARLGLSAILSGLILPEAA